jgi:hypothetical protein
MPWEKIITGSLSEPESRVDEAGGERRGTSTAAGMVMLPPTAQRKKVKIGRTMKLFAWARVA